MINLRTQNEIMAFWKGDIETPVVSICCITYNHEAYIEDALKGFLIQETDFPFEILIHDDVSTDDTPNIIREYAAKYPELIKPIYQSVNQYNQGKKVNIEFNFSRAKGKYIAICEGDDFWIDHKKLNIQKEFLENHPEYVICYTDVTSVNEDGDQAHDFGGARRDLSSIDLKKATSIHTLTAMFRNLITSVPPELRNAKYGDLTIWSQLGQFGKGKYLGHVKPSIYRIHPGGVHSMQTTEKQIKMRLDTMASLYGYWLTRNDEAMADYFLGEVIVQTLRLKRFGFFESILSIYIQAIKRKFLRLLGKNIA